jgi:hypothetical protein
MVRREAMLPMLLVISCTPGGSPAPLGPTLVSEPVAATTACYQGESVGAGQHVRTIARRTVDPAAHQIIKDVVHDDAGGTKSFHIVMKVDGARFTITDAADGYTGSGTLLGEPWAWRSWTTTSQLASAGLVIESRDELTATGTISHKEIKKDGAVVASVVDDLTTFDCAGWDAAKAQLAVVVLDDALCDRACRQFATVKYWAVVEPALNGLPASERDAVRRGKTAELNAKLDTGAPPCIAACRAANNAAQTACIAHAATVDQLGACEAK